MAFGFTGSEDARVPESPLVPHGIKGFWGWAAYPLTLFACTRLGLVVFSFVSMRLVPALQRPVEHRDVLAHLPALDGFCRWDCPFYEDIARDGYIHAGYSNFFPLFPWATRLLHEVTRLPIPVALIVTANLASLGSFLLIHRVMVRLDGEEAARWGLALFALFPFSFFQSAAYPESMMVLFSAAAILLALRGNHLAAGIALGLGTLARHLTLLGGGALVCAQLRQRGTHPRRLLLDPALLGLLAPFAVAAIYPLFLAWRFGDPWAFWEARSNWGPSAWMGAKDVVRDGGGGVWVNAFMAFALIPTVGAIALALRNRWLELACFALPLLLVLWTIGLAGLGRYSASCWPAFLPLGVWLSRRPRLQAPVVGTLGMFQGLFFFLFAHQYNVL